MCLRPPLPCPLRSPLSPSYHVAVSVSPQEVLNRLMNFLPTSRCRIQKHAGQRQSQHWRDIPLRVHFVRQRGGNNNFCSRLWLLSVPSRCHKECRTKRLRHTL